MINLSSLSIKRKIFIAVSLITLIPVLVFLNLYLKNIYISPYINAVIFIIIILGWWIIFDIVFSFINIHNKTKKTFEKIVEEKIEIPNEIESLEKILNTLSLKVKTSYEELKNLSQKTEELNKDVSRKISTLSTILEANNLISKGISAEDVIQFLINRLGENLLFNFSSCIVKVNQEKLKPIACFGIEVSLIEKILNEEKNFLLNLNEIKVLDKRTQSPIYSNLKNKLILNSFIIYPFYYKNNYLGAIILGSIDDFIDLDENKRITLELFVQNISLTWQHKQLLLKTEELDIIDYLTDLYNERYIKIRLEEEISRSIEYQRPCGFILLEIKNYKEYEKEFGTLEAEKLLKKLAKNFKENLRPIDIVGRFEQNILAAIVIEKNKRQLENIITELNRKINPVFEDKFVLDYSIAEIPIDGVSSQEIISSAKNRLNSKNEIL